MFLSTPPSRVATRGQPFAQNMGDVSIHATLAGGDRFPMASATQKKCFYPRHPRGWRLAYSTGIAPGTGFYPRHPRGWRPNCGQRQTQKQSFYPRHPRGWRQCERRQHSIPKKVSIHATLAGGDHRSPGRALWERNVSIHATLAGGDTYTPSGISRCHGFYPRHPRGWRRNQWRLCGYPYDVSIHATLAGGD